MNERYDGDDRESRTAFRAYDTLSEPVSGRTPWQIWRDACAWQASRATPADHSVPVAIGQFAGWCYPVDGRTRFADQGDTVDSRFKNLMQPVYYASHKPPQPEAQSVRDAVIEECAKVCDEIANNCADYREQYAVDICCEAIRASKSAPPQKPVSDEVKP